MIDTHSHILPGVDDGTTDETEALALLRVMVSQGIRTVVATPHHHKGRYVQEAELVKESLNELQKVAIEQGIDVALQPGMEVQLYEGLLNDLERGRVLTLNGSRYLLLELPAGVDVAEVDELNHELQLMGIVPILAHPERNPTLQAEPEALVRLVEAGMLCQMVASSIVDMPSRKLRRFAYKLCQHGLVHLLASDAHDVRRRPCLLREAYAAVGRKLGTEFVDRLQAHARSVVVDASIEVAPPVSVRSAWFGRIGGKNSF